MPFFREFKGGGYAFGGHPFTQLLIGAEFLTRRANPQPRARTPAAARGLDMDPINIALWLILVGLIAIVPVGCILTRRDPNRPRTP